MLRLLIKNHQVIYKPSFLKFAQTASLIETTSSSIEKKSIFNAYLSELNELDRNSIANILNFVTDRPKTGLAAKSLTNFLKEKYFPDYQILEKDIDEIVDMLQDADQTSTSVVKLEEVHLFLEAIKQTQGKGSINRKMEMLEEILDKMNVLQIKTLLRILNKKLRIGMATKSFAPFHLPTQAKSIGQENQNNQIKQEDLEKADKIKMPNIDLMLSKSLKNIHEVWKFCDKKKSQKCPKLMADLKYDGERTLIIYKRGVGLELMSRRKKWQTQIYKSLHAALLQELDKIPNINSIQIDGQILCVSETGDHLPMQTLLTKRGKQSTEDEKTKLLIFAFDVIEYNGSDITNQPLMARRHHLPTTQHIKPSEFIEFQYPDGREDLLNFYKLALEKKRQGLIIKGTNDLYFTNGSRRHWGKFKKGCKIHGQDTGEIDLDLVVMGVENGGGKNSSRYSAFLLGVYHQDKLYPVSKVGSGLTQAQLDEMTQIFEKLIVSEKPDNFQIPKALKIDHFVKPIYVFKVTCQDLSRSPHYKLKYEQGVGGISLRFPVFQQIRDDKSPESCTSADLFQFLDGQEDK